MAVKADYYNLRRTTSQQRRLDHWLRNHDNEPEVEYAVDECGITVDLAYPNLKLAIEVDGGYHTTWKQQDEDCRRDSLLQRAGWKVIRVTNDEIDRNLSSVGYSILEEIHRRGKRLSRNQIQRPPFRW